MRFALKCDALCTSGESRACAHARSSHSLRSPGRRVANLRGGSIAHVAALVLAVAGHAGCSCSATPAPPPRPQLPIVELPSATAAGGKISFSHDKAVDSVSAGQRTLLVVDVQLADDSLNPIDLETSVLQVTEAVPGANRPLIVQSGIGKLVQDGNAYRIECDLMPIREPGTYQATLFLSSERQASCELVVK